MKVSVIIPCRNEELYIGKCIDSVLAGNYPSNLIEILVCDGLSTDTTPIIVQDYSRKHPQVRLIENQAMYTPHALNAGIKASEGDVVIILGAHSELSPDYISQCIKILEQFPAVGCTGGLVKNIPMNAVSEIIAMAMASEFGVGNVRFRTGGKAGYVDTVAFGAYRREVFEKVGLFDERLVRNQDDEMNFRLTEYGYKIYFEPGISSNYYVRGSWKGLIRQYYQYGYWKVCVNVMHRKITTWRQLVPFIFVMFVIFGALGSAFLPFIFPMYIAGLGVYFAGSVLSSIRQTSIPIKALKLMFAFFVLHASYGFGFAEGLCWFAILGRKPHQKTFRLSR